VNDVRRQSVVLDANTIGMRDQKPTVSASRVKKTIVLGADGPLYEGFYNAVWRIIGSELFPSLRVHPRILQIPQHTVSTVIPTAPVALGPAKSRRQHEHKLSRTMAYGQFSPLTTLAAHQLITITAMPRRTLTDP